MFKKLFRWIKGSLLIAAILASLVIGVSTLILVSYEQGQMDACNAMLRNDPNTELYGLYCEQMPNGVTIRSSVLKMSIFNLTLDKTYLMIGR